MKLIRLFKIAAPSLDWVRIKPIGGYDGVHVTMTRKEWSDHLALMRHYRERLHDAESRLAALMEHAAQIGDEV